MTWLILTLISPLAAGEHPPHAWLQGEHRHSQGCRLWPQHLPQGGEGSQQGWDTELHGEASTLAWEIHSIHLKCDEPALCLLKVSA